MMMLEYDLKQNKQIPGSVEEIVEVIKKDKIDYQRLQNVIYLWERDQRVEFNDNFKYDKFDWDEKKLRDNVTKHRVSFYEATTVFSSFLPLLTEYDNQHSQDEERYKTIGYSNKKRLLVVIHTDRGNKIRIISAWKANNSEERKYDEHFK